MAGHVVALERRALLVDLGLRPHDDAGDAEPALQATAGRERVGIAPALVLVHSLQRDHVPAGDLRHVVRARDLHLAVDHHGAAAALPGG